MARNEKSKSLFSFGTDVEDELTNSGIAAYGKREDEELDDTGYMKIKMNELMAGDTYDGTPEATIFFNEGKKSKDGKPLNYDSLRIRLWDTNNKELLDVYANVPIVDAGTIKAIRKGNKFMRSGFDMINSFYKVVGAEVPKGTNKFTDVDLLQIIDYINEADNLTIKATAIPGSKYGSAEIIKIE